MYNVYEAFLYKNKQFIFALSFTPGLDIKKIINDISLPFNFVLIKLEKNNDINYTKLNKDVNIILEENELKINSNTPIHHIKGILIYGISFPPKLLQFKIDIHLHISLSKNIYLKYNNDDLYNHYLKLLDSNIIYKYFNIKDEDININDLIFDKIIEFIEKNVYGKDYKKLSYVFNKSNSIITNNKHSNSESISLSNDYDNKSIDDDDNKSIDDDDDDEDDEVEIDS